MEFKLTKATNEADAVLSVNIKLADIEEEAKKALHTAKQRLNLPGFRPGKIPTDIAKKYLWESVIKQELEKKLEHSIEDYFKTNNIEIIKPLLPIQSDREINLKSDTEFTFDYNIGIIDGLSFEPKDILSKVPYYAIKTTKKDIEEEIEHIRHNYGKHAYPEIIENKEGISLTLNFTELDAQKKILEGGVTQTLYKKLKQLPSNLGQILFAKKKGEEFEVNIKEHFIDKAALAEFLEIDKLAAEDLNHEFLIKVVSIHEEEEAELNEELFDKITQGKAKTIEEFRSEIEEMIKSSYERQAKNHLSDEIINTLIDKLDIKLPVQYLELLFNEEYAEKLKEMTSDQIKQEKTEFDKKIKWSIIAEYISKKYSVELTEKEIIEEAYIYLYSYFYQYGIQNSPDDKMANYVTEYLKNPENLNFTQRKVTIKKILEKIKSEVTFEKKEITSDKFKKLKQEK